MAQTFGRTAFKVLLILVVVASVLICPGPAVAEDSGKSFGERAKQRESKRWTLQEWLDTKDRNRMMDMWLSMNSSSPFEVMIGAAYKSYVRKIDLPFALDKFTSVDGSFTAHAQLVGITIEHENNTQENLNDLSGMLNLRLFGESIQSTYLALHVGQRTRTYTSFLPHHDFKNLFGQVTLQLYLMKYFGVDGFHRIYSSSRNFTANEELSGTLSEAGLFIDFKALRIFGSAYRDEQLIKSTLTPYTETTTMRSGTRAGVKIFF